jgi:hypothetical protein
MTPNGYSGTGLIPRASTLPSGTTTVDFSRALPGATAPSGYNYQFAFGFTEGLEASYRLATQVLACNLFTTECPPNTIRDLSGSVKWAPSITWLNSRNIDVAVGASDIGGAATNFRNYYAVVGGNLSSLGMSRLEWTAGYAKSGSPTSALNGVLLGLDARPTDWSFISVQKAGSQSSIHTGIKVPVPGSRMEFMVAAHAPIDDVPTYPKRWGSVGLSIPLSAVAKPNGSKFATATETPRRALTQTAEADVLTALRRQGLHQAELRQEDQALKVVVENTAFPHNVLDALGVALGVLAGVESTDNKPRRIELIITHRGMPLVFVRSNTECLKAWIRNDTGCDQVELKALAHEAPEGGTSIYRGAWWTTQVRPELIVAPVITSAIGTEVGAFDADLGYLVNAVLPLWRGATADWAYIKTPGWRTGEFKDGGVYATERLREGVARRMVHQVIDIPRLNTRIRLSLGRGFSVWDGRHLETVSTSPNGAHRIGVIAGDFKGPIPRDPFFGLPIVDAPTPRRQYELVQYRWAHGPNQTWHSEVTAGTFWGQDKGALFTQRFWFADSNVAVYYRRSTMPEMDRPISFAGIQLTVPLTTRRSAATGFGSLRGSNAFFYAIESKVQETDNYITRGYGEIPRFGETINTIYNRDRFDGPYLRAHEWRIREAFNRLTRD